MLETPFQDYLEAKYHIDERSLNPSVRSRFLSEISNLAVPIGLDVGTGTGAMIRRVTGALGHETSYWTGIDLRSDTVVAARSVTSREFAAAGYHVSKDAGSMRATKEGRTVTVDYVVGDIFDNAVQHGLIQRVERQTGTVTSHPFNVVTAHAVSDMVPLHSFVEVISGLLASGGIAYFTINYDGKTVIEPVSAEAEFERQLLHVYNQSMDERHVDGLPVGGSRSGSRLPHVLRESGYQVLETGSSDWRVAPVGGRYGPGEELFLTAIITMIYQEGKLQAEGRHPELHTSLLDRWYEQRRLHIRDGILSLSVGQSDIVARRNRK